MASTEASPYQYNCNKQICAEEQVSQNQEIRDPYTRAIARISQKIGQYNHHQRRAQQIQHECCKAKAIASWRQIQRLL